MRQAAEKLVQACSCYAKSLSIRRTLEAWINLGVALVRAGDRPEAAKAFARYLELDKDSGWAKLARERLTSLR